MEVQLEEHIFNNSKSLKQVLNFLDQKNIIKLSSRNGLINTTHILISFLESFQRRREQPFFQQVILESTQQKLLEDFLRLKMMIPNEKYSQILKTLYSNYLSSICFSQKFGIKSIEKWRISNDKEDDNANIEFLEKFGVFIEEKENNIKKYCEDFQTNNLNEISEKLKNKRIQKRQFQLEILHEKLKLIYYNERINEKLKKFNKDLAIISKFKINNQLEDENIEIFYQEKLLKNLKLHREALEKKLLSDLYSEEQTNAINFIKIGIEKKMNLLINNKNYMDQRLRELEKGNEDLNFVEVVSQISDVNKIIQRREQQLIKLQTLSNRFE